MRKGVMLDLVLTSEEGLVSNVKLRRAAMAVMTIK